MEEIRVALLPQTIYLETIERGEKRVERFFLHVVMENRSQALLTVDSVELEFRNVGDGCSLTQRFEGHCLDRYFEMARSFLLNCDDGGRVLAPAQTRGIIALHGEVDGLCQFTELSCTVLAHRSDSTPVKFCTKKSLCRAVFTTSLVLPVKGRWWVAGGHLEFEPHRRGRLPSTVYAYDFVRIGDDSKTYRGTGDKNTDYFAYGEPVMAAADGTVEMVQDGYAENLPGTKPSDASEVSTEVMAGNHVVLEHAPGEYSFYAHLQPRILVKQGTKIMRGEILGYVGNSGESSEPHLHFHFAEGPTLHSVGLPIYFHNWLEDAFSCQPSLVESGVLLSGEVIQACTPEESCAQRVRTAGLQTST